MKIGSLALPLMLALLALPGALRATTTVSGNLKDLGTNAASGFVRFSLKGCSGNQPTVPGVAVLAPTQGAVWFKDFVADASGHISGTLYSTRDNAGTGNGEIQCGTSFISVYYGMQVFTNGKGGPEISVHAKNGTTLDPGTVIPITVTPVVTAPTGDSTYARLDGGNQPFSGNVTAPRLISTVATGTAPLVVSSTTNVPNLNASLLNGATFAAPGAIGGTTPGSGAFTTVSAASLTANGTVAGLTGTGACATFSGQAGGAWAGSARCTGATAASTLTITFGISAPAGWICSVYDLTTRANLFQQTAQAVSSCVLTATNVNQNDVFVFSAIAF